MANSTEKRTPKFIVWLGLGLLMLSVATCNGWLDTGNPEPPTRKQQVDGFFSGYDGSHTSIDYAIKQNLNDPESYEFVENTYRDDKETITVFTTFRAKNAFGGVITQTAQSTLNGYDGRFVRLDKIK